MKRELEVALLTGGGDRPYVFGLSTALVAKGIRHDLIAGDELDIPELRAEPLVTFLNLRGDQSRTAALSSKMTRVAAYYGRLIRYAATAKPKLFHILWNNRFEFVDRTLLMLFYKVMGRKIVMTAHNVNTRKRDSTDTLLNRLTLRVQYRLADHIFVHTEKMKLELLEDYGVGASSVSVIPFGINNSVPVTALTREEARRQLGLANEAKVLLFFGRIAPYKGLKYLVQAFQRLAPAHPDLRVVIAGRPKRDGEEYLKAIQDSLSDEDRARIVQKIEFVPDEQTELYFKAADALVLAYTDIAQSGVLFLAYSFGLPVIAADVGSLKDDIVEGRTGLVCAPADSADLARSIERYFSSRLYLELSDRRNDIRDYANERYSWDTVGRITRDVYAELLGLQPRSPQLATMTRSDS